MYFFHCFILKDVRRRTDSYDSILRACSGRNFHGVCIMIRSCYGHVWLMWAHDVPDAAVDLHEAAPAAS